MEMFVQSSLYNLRVLSIKLTTDDRVPRHGLST